MSNYVCYKKNKRYVFNISFIFSVDVTSFSITVKSIDLLIEIIFILDILF
jgi:hypothetical protein